MTALQLGLVLGTVLWASCNQTRAAPIELGLPVRCSAQEVCLVQNYVDVDPGPLVRDYLCSAQTYQGHNGVDIRIADMVAQRRGAEVLAAAPGPVLRFRDEVPDATIGGEGALSVVGQECGNGVIIDHGDGWQTQYCHLARGSLSVRAGQTVSRGEVLGLVGLSGMTEYPHVHLTVRHNGKVVDPFGPSLPDGRCSPLSGADLWTPVARRFLQYRAGAVLNAGFSGSLVSMGGIERGALTPASEADRFLVGYVRSVHLKVGDIQSLVVTGPEGGGLASTTLPALDHDLAQSLVYVGLRRPELGWVSGVYSARYRVLRSGREVVTKVFDHRL